MMKTSLSLALALAVFGCANDNTGDDDHVDPGQDPGMEDPMPDPPRKIDAQGTYRVHSTFDVATNMPGNAGSFVNGLIAATDDPDDPMSWVLDQMLAQMEPGTLKSILQGAKPFVAGALNQELIDLAPDLVTTIVEVGQRMEDLTKHFGVNEKVAITVVDQTLLAQITVDGVRFNIDGIVTDELFADHDIDNVVVNGVFVRFENEARLDFGQHSLPLPYGKIVRMGLDAAIIPAIDPSASNLTELLDTVVDCAGVGQAISDALDVGSAAFWQSACLGGLSYASDLVYDQIADADSLLGFHLMGTARAADSNSDFKVDKITFGQWSGSMTYTGTDAALAQPATFVGERM